MDSQYEELGAKVQRAQEVLSQIRGFGEVGGVAIEVDADNVIQSVRLANTNATPAGLASAIVDAYREALADAKPKVDDAVRPLRDDQRVSELATREPEPAQPPRDDTYFEQFQQDPLGRRR